MSRSATLLLAVALTLLAGDGFSPLGPGRSGAENAVPRVAPGFFDPAQRAGSAYKNLDPEYRRASYWARLHSLVTGATWLVSESRVAPLPLGTPDSGRPARSPPARADRDLDRPLDRAGPARRRQLPDRSDLGRSQRSLQRLHRRAPLHAARYPLRRPAAHRLRPDLPRPLRPSRRAHRAPPGPHVRSALRRAPRHQGVARRSRHHQRGGARLGRVGHGQGVDGGVHAGAARRRAAPPSTRAVGSGPRGRCWARSASTSAATPATIATSRRPATGSAPSTWPPCRSGPTRRATSPSAVHISPEEALQAALDLRASHTARRALGHLRPRPGAVRRAAGPHARRDRAARDRPGHRLDPQAGRDPDLVVFSLSPTGRGQGEGPTSSSTGTGSSRAVGSRSRA